MKMLFMDTSVKTVLALDDKAPSLWIRTYIASRLRELLTFWGQEEKKQFVFVSKVEMPALLDACKTSSKSNSLKALECFLHDGKERKGATVRHIVTAVQMDACVSAIAQFIAKEKQWDWIHVLGPSVLDPWNVIFTSERVGAQARGVFECYYQMTGDLKRCPTSFQQLLSVWKGNRLL